MQVNPTTTSVEYWPQTYRSLEKCAIRQTVNINVTGEFHSQEIPPANRLGASTCRLSGCYELACGAHGFCVECRLVYECRALVRERHLRSLAAQIERDHRALVDRIAPHGAPRTLLLAHAAAHQHHNRERSPGITSAAVRDFLDEAMERLTAQHLR